MIREIQSSDKFRPINVVREVIRTDNSRATLNPGGVIIVIYSKKA